MQHHGGHLFVVHGRIECVVHDAAIVPTDDAFALEPTWHPLLPAEPDDVRPDDWPGTCVARAGNGQALWFVSVGDGDLSTEALVDRMLVAVREVAEARLRPVVENRVKPVLAVPVLGIEGGGHENDRGDVVRAQLEALHHAVRELDLDVAVVIPEPSVYGAAQHVRGWLDPWQFDESYLHEAQRLGRLARTGDLALFVGAGVSIPAGLPSWGEMLRMLGERGGIEGGADPGRLTALDHAELLQRRLPDLGRHVAELTREHDRPSLGHTLLAGLRCREAITTNYDQLYEQAVAATGHDAPAVLPRESAVGAPTWLLKLHGDVDDPASIVLTRRDFVRFDAHTRPAGALLQSLALTRHLLFVGASLADDNVVRLLREVQVFREEHGLHDRFGTMLTVSDDSARSELWRDELSWLSMPGESRAERARALEIFLDTVSWYAADAASWVLDPRFAGLLDKDARATAGQARDLRRRLEEQAAEGDMWAPLRQALDDLGAPKARSGRHLGT